jgi:hypothetical protein
MAPSIKRVAALLGSALAAGTILATASPAQAWCTAQPPNPPVQATVCSSGYCYIAVLGDEVYSCQP